MLLNQKREIPRQISLTRRKFTQKGAMFLACSAFGAGAWRDTANSVSHGSEKHAAFRLDISLCPDIPYMW